MFEEKNIRNDYYELLKMNEECYHQNECFCKPCHFVSVSFDLFFFNSAFYVLVIERLKGIYNLLADVLSSQSYTWHINTEPPTQFQT